MSCHDITIVFNISYSGTVFGLGSLILLLFLTVH